MITSDKIFKVVENFRKYKGKFKIDMGATCTRNHPCGTVCCHAGAYYITKRFIGDFIPRVMDKYCEMEEVTPYGIGRQIMALDLGFDDFRELLVWAKDNKDIWGNKYGEYMFSSKDAFVRFGAEVTLEKIINHWEGVGRRLRQREIREGRHYCQPDLKLIAGEKGEAIMDDPTREAV